MTAFMFCMVTHILPSYLQLAMASAMLSAPHNSPIPEIAAEEWPAMQLALHSVAIQWQILDPREVRYVLARQDDLDNDLNLLRRRYHDLHDAPLVQDSLRFPDRGTVNEMLAFNRAFRRHLDSKQFLEYDRSFIYQVVLKETDRLYQIWDSVRDARCDFYYVTVRRQALKRLRNLIGAEAYHTGELPPYVPVWRFQEIQ